MSHMRGTLGRLPHERVPHGIGHNQGPPLDPGASWRRHVWKRARKALLPRLPLEVVRRRITRARELGLEYPQYASILLGTGRDIVAFLFTDDGLGLRLSKSLEMPEPVVAKLAGLRRTDRLLMTAPELTELAGCSLDAFRTAHKFAAHGPTPKEPASYADGRQAIRAILDPMRLPGDVVVMVGARTEERNWADAAKLAAFLPADRYFATVSR